MTDKLVRPISNYIERMLANIRFYSENSYRNTFMIAEHMLDLNVFFIIMGHDLISRSRVHDYYDWIFRNN